MYKSIQYDYCFDKYYSISINRCLLREVFTSMLVWLQYVMYNMSAVGNKRAFWSPMCFRENEFEVLGGFRGVGGERGLFHEGFTGVWFYAIYVSVCEGGGKFFKN